MTKNYLDKNYTVSSYNEGTCEQIDYYINENTCENNDIAYRYLHENDKWLFCCVFVFFRR